MYDCLFFDLDGTLADSFDGITTSVVYALEKSGVHGVEKTALKHFIGPPLLESFTAFFGGDAEKGKAAVGFYREYYSVDGWKQARIYDGVKSALEELKAAGKRLAMATSKPEVFATRIADRFGLTRYFELVAGASLDSTRMTKDAVLAYAIEKMRAEKLRSVMIGDRKHDIDGAKSNEIDSIGVLYGYGSRDELAAHGATHIVETPAELVELILRGTT